MEKDNKHHIIKEKSIKEAFQEQPLEIRKRPELPKWDNLVPMEPRVHKGRGFIYIDTNDDSEALKIEKAFSNLLTSFEIDYISHKHKFKKGSRFKKIIVYFKNIWSDPQLQARLSKIEQALEISNIDKPKSEITKNQLEAVSAFLSSTKDLDKCVFQLENFVFLKKLDSDGHPMAFGKFMDEDELNHLKLDPNVLKNPDKLYDILFVTDRKTLIELNSKKQKDRARSHIKK